MTLPRPRIPELSGAALPRVVVLGVGLVLVSILLGGTALYRTAVLSGSKADKASAASQRASEQARSDSLLVVCAAVDAQRSGNPRRPPATSDLGLYSGRAWEAVYVKAGCDRFTAEQLDAAIRSALAVPTSPGPTPAPS